MIYRTDEQPEPLLPQRLADDLGRLYPPGPPVPPGVDAQILGRARGHFARHRRVRLILGWAAASAAAAVIALVVRLSVGPQSTPTNRPQITQISQIGNQAGTTSAALAREDIDRNGRVDILDAFALARDVEHGTAAAKAFDLDGDGRVGRGDVDAVATSAVRLERGTLQ